MQALEVDLDTESDDDDIQIMEYTALRPTSTRTETSTRTTEVGGRMPTRSAMNTDMAESTPSSFPPSQEPILVGSDEETDNENDDIIIEGERQVSSDEDLQITGERRHRPELHFGTRDGQAGFYLSLPREQRYIPLSGGEVRQGGVRTPLFVPSRPPAARTRQRLHLRNGRSRRTIPARNASVSQLVPNVLDDIDNGGPALRDFYSIRNFVGSMFGRAMMYFGREEDIEESIPESLMEEISRREQVEEDTRVNKRQRVADKMRSEGKAKANISEDQKSMFTRAILPENESICTLCGVKLVEGIPEDYDVLTDEKKIKDLVLHEGIRSPWQCCKKLTSIDTELSKKVFFGKCGHVYCGRCVNNITRGLKETQGAREKRKRRRKKLDLDKVSVTELDFDDPDISAPSRCVVDGCNRLLRGRYFFRELYI
ncbi:DEKNAAC102678 [Brettanomyces naardenensis]|uniref:DEKNAAC102678 n=1 Tax=Brettanomyces naardenensis TaxID=13370 RepID=A0A448YL07_BRENA|nr:DEKNAAC102678 [Brettanomyces naardenensis]